MRLALVFLISLLGAHEALAQNGAIINTPTEVIINPVVEPTVVTGQVLTPVIPTVVQPQYLITPTVNPNAAGITDPVGNPYRNVNPNPLTTPVLVTPAVSPFLIPVIQNPS
jgi:hypothetical protein